MTKALEACIARRSPTVAPMQIDSVGVALPNLDPRAGNGPGVGVQHAPGEMKDIATRLTHRTLDANKIGIIVAGHPFRVERTLAGTRRWRKRSQRGPRHKKRRSRENERAARQTIPRHVKVVRHVIFPTSGCGRKPTPLVDFGRSGS